MTIASNTHDKRRRDKKNQTVIDFILSNVEAHPQDIASLTGREFGLSRNTIATYLRSLTQEGVLDSQGNTNARRYTPRKIVDIVHTITLFDGLPEDRVWEFRILPHIKTLKPNIIGICQYGFTEILNNAIDHSASEKAIISFEQTYNKASIKVIDYGIGIFEKIRKDFDLADRREALLELSKGKITSAPSRHAGEGIFFTSRMFDKFNILSGDLFYTRERKENNEWLVESGKETQMEKGTYVSMEISTHATWTTNDVFMKYMGDDIGFRKTHVPLNLGRYPGEQLVSRSQAKRVLARFDKFSEVLLDFKGVDMIGQAFADEIFRVFKYAHPETEIIAINKTPDIDRMIAHVQATDEKRLEEQFTFSFDNSDTPTANS